jgi:hypothetical protein
MNFASLEFGFEYFQTSQNGIGMKRPKNLGQYKECTQEWIVTRRLMYMANGMSQYGFPKAKSSFPRAPIAIEA